VEVVLAMRACRRVKVLLLQGLVQEMRQVHFYQELMPSADLPKGRSNCEVLSTAVSECPSIGYQLEKEVEELEERIISLRTVKFEQNEHIEALEEELDGKERVAIARSEYNDRLKHKMLVAMQTIE
jgi:hypothetical protein